MIPRIRAPEPQEPIRYQKRMPYPSFAEIILIYLAMGGGAIVALYAIGKFVMGG